MVKRRGVVAGWDSTHSNPDGSTGRPKGVQTAADMRVATSYDILGEGILLANGGVPAITTSPLNTISISPFMAAILSPKDGYYIIKVTTAETVTLDLTKTGAVKVYVQQRDWEIANDVAAKESDVVFGAVYGAAAIPAGALLLFTSTLSGQSSTSGMTFTAAFKYTGAASGAIRVPLQADLTKVITPTNGMRALVLGGAGAGEYVYASGSSSWVAIMPSNNLAAAYPVGSIYMNASNNANPATLFGFGTWVAFGIGRMLVGVDAADTDFNAAGKTGGAKTHTLSVAEMPSHYHDISQTRGGVNWPGGGFSTFDLTLGGVTGTGYRGGGGAHNNMPPYVTVYMWNRTA